MNLSTSPKPAQGCFPLDGSTTPSIVICLSMTLAAILSAERLLYPQDSNCKPSAEHGSSYSHQSPAGGNGSDPQDYFISADDDLEIYVLDVPEISRSYRVSPKGMITLPLLPDPIPAGGMTLDQLAQAISDRLQTGGMVSQPHVTVQVRESRVHGLAIMGAVKKPQIYPLFGRTTLVDALSQAEGLAEDAGSMAIVTRGEIATNILGSGQDGQAKGSRQSGVGRVIRVDLGKLLEDGDGDLNLDLYPGDEVTVQRADIVYVVGAVNRAGGFVLKNDRGQMTVLKAIALAENLKSTAIPRKAIIIRKHHERTVGEEEIPVNLASILSGHTPDSPLLNNDILFVPDSTGRKALHRAGEAAAQAAALLIYRVP